MAFPTYSTGTVAIAANGTSIAGTGSNWTGQNAMPGDTFTVPGVGSIEINDVTDALTLAIDAWPFGAVTAGTAYNIKKDSPLRFAGGQAMADVSTLVAALNTDGFYVFVGPDLLVPDPSYGNDNQYAFQATTGKLWQKTGGTWNFIGTQKGFSVKGAWDSATAYLPFDVVELDGTSYVALEASTNETPSTGDSPPNAFWAVLAAKGEAGHDATIAVGTVTTGAGGSAAAVTNSGTPGAAVFDFTIPQGEGYAATSTTSLAIGTGSKAFTTQSGLAYSNGARVRASSAAGTTNWVEGLVTYSGTTLTMTVTKTNGSGTHADWNLNVVGEPGAGDLSSANNLSDLANAATARTNLGAAASATTISGSGLVTGGGDLSANRTLTVSAASKSDQQTGSSSTVAVTPAHQQDHASAAKAWCLNSGASTPASVASYNISSLTDNGAGDTTYNFTTAMASANYSAAALTQSGVPFTTQAAPRNIDIVSRATSGIRIQTGAWSSTGGAFVDLECSMAVYGAQ